MSNFTELAASAQSISDDLKKLTADMSNEDEVENLKDDAYELAYALEDAWEAAHQDDENDEDAEEIA